jgi:hypothetical protein
MAEPVMVDGNAPTLNSQAASGNSNKERPVYKPPICFGRRSSVAAAAAILPSGLGAGTPRAGDCKTQQRFFPTA